MPLTVAPPVDYSEVDYHWSTKISIGQHACICDECQGYFRHGIVTCSSLIKVDKKWLCINCRGGKKI